mgnify:CR=1 FL=1
MKSVSVFYVNDSRLTVYVCRSGEVKILDVFDFSDSSAKSRFTEYVESFKKTKNYMLLDVSVEDYHQEQLPHVKGYDRKRLIERKLVKYFPDGEYCYSALVKRLKVGRRDDIYAISGIADSSAINQVVDGVASSGIEISGVYSLPLITESLMSPVVHSDQVLVIFCDDEKGGRYSFRQTFVDNGNLYFSRQTSISSNVDEAADQFRKEIDRTWQYLNNKRILTAGDRMQVILVTPPAFGKLLRNEAVASHSDYLFVDPVELALNHGCRADSFAINCSAIASFLLVKNTPAKPHYQPKKLTVFHKHQQINRFLRNASVFVVMAAIVFTAMNFKAYNTAVQKGEDLVYRKNEAIKALNLQDSGFSDRDTSPQNLQAMVNIYKTVESTDSYPAFIFSIISKSFSKYKDLAISDIEWRVQPVGDGDNPTDSIDDYSMNPDFGSSGDGESGIQPSSDQGLPNAQDIVINIEGSIQSFNGNYRRAIKRVKSISSHLRAQKLVKSVLVTKLPLNVDPSVKTSRTLSSAVMPVFGIRVTLNARVLSNEN